mmetsp:Transcript_11031/g.36615  ORF Transcript_11031/g.36615 Transcript_11031/m.36615 type:complete len:232 (+) Transcript_11031:635-1330(+)
MRARRSSFSWSSSRFSETLRDRNDNLGRLAARLPSSAGTAATSPTDICRICTLCSSNCVSLDRVMSPAKQCLDARPSALWPSASAEAPSSASTAVLATGKPLCVVERSISRTKPTVVSVSCRTCTLVAMMERAERIQLSASAVEVAVDRSKAAPPSSIWMSYSEIVKRSPTSLDERIASMIGRSRLMSFDSSTTITVSEIVIRVTPPSMPAAPTRAYTPGETRDMPNVSPA